MLNLTELVGFGAGGNVAAISYASAGTSASSATTHTYTGLSLGTAAAGRVIVVCASAISGGSRTISSITVHVPDVGTDPTGTSLAEVAVASDTTGGGSNIAAIWSGVVASGTSGDVKVTYSGGVTNTGVSVFAVTGVAAAADSTGTDTTISGSDLSASVTGYAGGVAVGCCYWNETAPCTTWANLTEATDQDLGGGRTQSAASVAVTTAGAFTITATCSGSPSRNALAVASWRPA